MIEFFWWVDNVGFRIVMEDPAVGLALTQKRRGARSSPGSRSRTPRVRQARVGTIGQRTEQLFWKLGATGAIAFTALALA